MISPHLYVHFCDLPQTDNNRLAIALVIQNGKAAPQRIKIADDFDNGTGKLICPTIFLPLCPHYIWANLSKVSCRSKACHNSPLLINMRYDATLVSQHNAKTRLDICLRPSRLCCASFLQIYPKLLHPCFPSTAGAPRRGFWPPVRHDSAKPAVARQANMCAYVAWTKILIV